MKFISKIFFLTAIVVTLASCGGNTEKGKLGDKKAALEKLKKEQKDLSAKIEKLVAEIEQLDSTAVKAKLVSIEKINDSAFNHYIDLQGMIDAKKTAYVAPKMPGVVRAIYVKQGDFVKQGQVILKLDDAVARQQVNAAQQQITVVRSQLELAKTVLERQQNLWNNNIGTEMQVLQARTNVETLSGQLRAAEAAAAMAKEQLNYSNVTADINGVIDAINVRVGEQFSGVSSSGAQVSIVNTSVLKLAVEVPETYIGSVRVGTPLIITLPDANNRIINSTVAVVSKLINPSSRTFSVEANVPSDPNIKANQVAKVQIREYSNSNAITVPLNTLQTDQEGKYVMVAVTENGRLIARKKHVVTGNLSGNRLEIKSGLSVGDQIITQGVEGVYEGQVVTTQTLL
jgi:RND family efflux transporter MFP subunit